MRFGLVVALGLVAGVAHAEPLKSDPAFLGIGMSPYGGMAGCMVTSVTPGTGAEAAGLKNGDVIVRIDGVAIATCDDLTNVITSHSIGDSVPLELTGSSRRTLIAQLSSRTEVMRRGMIGHPLAAELYVADDKAVIPLDLSASRRATIVGWFTPGCDCSAVFARVAKWTRTAHTDAYAVTVTNASTTSLAAQIAGYHFDLPVALTPTESGVPIILDSNRVMFIVVDARGQVSYIGTVAPTADDADAAMDELFLAADHAKSDRTLPPSRRAQTSRR